MSEACRSASLMRTSSIVVKIYSFKHKNMTKIPSAPVKLLCHHVDGRGFKVSFTRTKANRCRRGGGLKLSVLIEAYLQPCISDNLIRTCIGEDDCQKQQRCHECSELTVTIGIDIW